MHLEAWNPKIPLNSKDSGIPVIVFDFRVTNKCPDPIEVTVFSGFVSLLKVSKSWSYKNVDTSDICDLKAVKVTIIEWEENTSSHILKSFS